MKKIIVDTNALMAMAEFRIDLLSEIEQICDFPYQVYVLSGTILELHKIIEEQKNKYQRIAKLALSLLKHQLKVLPEEGDVDDLLAEHSLKEDIIVTQDILLKKRLTKPYLTIRQKKKVMMVR